MNAASTRLYRDESPDEPELVVSLATSLSLFSVCISVAAATGVAHTTSSWVVWPAASIAFTVIYILGIGAELGIAARQHPAGGADRKQSPRE